jgi:amino acid transporter
MTQQQDVPTTHPERLHGRLGVPQIVFMVVAMAAPLTVVAGLIPIMIAVGNGTGVPLDFILVALVLALFTVGFSAMTPEVEDAGAFYSYVQKGLGQVAGLGAASLAITTYLVLLVSVSAYLGAATRNALVSLVEISVPWWVLAGLCLLAIGLLGYRSIEMSARVLGALLVAEILVVAILDLAIVLQGGRDGLSAAPFSWEAFSQGAVGTGVMFAIFGFIGFEATAVFRSEAKDPDVTIPRATYTAVLLIGGLYAFTAWAVVNGAGVDHAVEMAGASPEGLTTDLADAYMSTFAHDTTQVLLATSFFACVLTAHNVVARYLFTLGSQGALPARFGAVHPDHRSPHVASLTTSVVVGGLLAVMALFRLDPVLEIYTWLGGAGTLGLIMLLTLTSVAVVVHFRRMPGRVSLWKGTVAPTIAFVSLGFILALVVRNFELLIGTAWLAYVLLAVMAGAMLTGPAWAAWLKTRRPATYDAIE